MITVKTQKTVCLVNIDHIVVVNDIPNPINNGLCQAILSDGGFLDSIEDQATINSKIYEARIIRRGQ